MSNIHIENLRQGINGLLSRVFPVMAEQQIESQLLQFNSNHSTQAKLPSNFEQGQLDTSEGWIKYYHVGSGPVVVFVHGWGGGAYQFSSLMRAISAAGYTSVAFDQIGHQGSEAKPATLQEQIRSTNEVLLQLSETFEDNLHAIVAHDTGCMIATNADHKLLNNLPLALIAPIFNYRLHFLRKLKELKLNPNSIKSYATDFIECYQSEYQPFELAGKLKHYTDNTLILHDKQDPVASFAESKKFCENHPKIRLVATQGKDHERIITAESVWQELKSHILFGFNTSSLEQAQLLAS